MMKNMKRVLALASALVMLLSLAACGNSGGEVAASIAPAESAAPAGSAAAGETAAADTGAAPTAVSASNVPENLTVGTSESLGNLLPFSSVGECGAGFYLVYDMLFYYDTNDQLASDIITDYSFEDNGYTLKLTMRSDIVFSSGNKATGEDLLFSLASTKDEARQAVTTNFDYFDFENSYVGDDGYTVYLKTLDTATAVSQFGNLALVCLLDKAWVEANGWESQSWYEGPSGSGPYEVKEYLTGNYYIFKLRDNYWMAGQRELPKEIKLIAYNEASTMYMDLENGDISIAVEPTSEDFERAMSGDEKNIAGKFINGNVCNWFVFDVENSAFSDINLRKAVAHAVKWDDVATAGKGVKHGVSTSTIPSYFPDYLNVGQYEYDPEYAKECLAAAGYEPGEFTFTMYIGPQQGTINSATLIQASLAEIGVNMKFESYEMSTVIPMWINGDGDAATFAMQGGSMARDSYWVFKELSSNATMADNRNIADTTYDDLLAKALVSPTQEEARQYYQQLQQHTYDTYRVVSYFEEVNAVCYNTDKIADVHFCSRVYPDFRFIVYK